MVQTRSPHLSSLEHSLLQSAVSDAVGMTLIGMTTKVFRLAQEVVFYPWPNVLIPRHYKDQSTWHKPIYSKVLGVIPRE